MPAASAVALDAATTATGNGSGMNSSGGGNNKSSSSSSMAAARSNHNGKTVNKSGKTAAPTKKQTNGNNLAAAAARNQPNNKKTNGSFAEEREAAAGSSQTNGGIAKTTTATSARKNSNQNIDDGDDDENKKKKNASSKKKKHTKAKHDGGTGDDEDGRTGNRKSIDVSNHTTGSNGSNSNNNMRRSNTMPSRSSNTAAAATAATAGAGADGGGGAEKNNPKLLRPYRSDLGPSATPRSAAHRLDRFGFIVNMDSRGVIQDEDDDDDGCDGPHHHHREWDDRDRVPTWQEAQRNERRTKKWKVMTESWSPSYRRTRSRLIVRRLRKGVPDGMRGTVWLVLGDVAAKMKKHPGLYERLVRQSVVPSSLTSPSNDDPKAAAPPAPSESSSKNNTSGDKKKKKKNKREEPSPPSPTFNHTKSFKNIQDTIERDIHRTFPRHSMFYEDEANDVPEVDTNNTASSGGGGGGVSSDDQEEDIIQLHGGLCPGAAAEITEMIRELEGGHKDNNKATAPTANGGTVEPSSSSQSATAPQPPTPPPQPLPHPDRVTAETLIESEGGQASLRRVLKAYSLFDREIGYCQGMNFIAGMFLTLVSEEEAFWLLVAIMYDPPCNMRGLFGEGMRETHKVLYVAEKLIQQFLPRLSKHLEKENIHVTMFATQWLLTQYTSSFRFDLVTRVWDCFLGEGWKITYRVMLAILSDWQSRILDMSFEEILAFFRELPDRTDGGPVVDAAVKIPLRKKHIAKYEKEWDEQNQPS